MNLTRIANVLLVASMLAQPLSVAAQQTATPLVGTWDSIKLLPPKEKLLVKMKDGSSKKGKLDSVTDATIALEQGRKIVQLGRDAIHQIYREVPKSRTRATWIGGGTGAGFAAIQLFGQGGDIDGSNAGAAVLVIAVFGAAGALIGRGAARSHERVLIYEARR